MFELFREGDFIESLEGFIFDVKGLVQPPESVVAFVRYVPDDFGDRIRNQNRYRKIYDLSERYTFLKKTMPEYLIHDNVFDEEIIEVPRKRILNHYEPLKKNRDLLSSAKTPLELKTIEMISYLSDASSVPKEEFGVSGSILVGLAGPESDIDIVVYGSDKCLKVRNGLVDLLKKGSEFQPYNEDKLRILYRSRHGKTNVSFQDFQRCEMRKSFQGYFKGTDFFVRYVKDFFEVEEKYGSIRYQNLGYGNIEGIVLSDDGGIFTPCVYPIQNAQVRGNEIEPPKEIVSFRGQFCEQARKGEMVTAYGKIEKCTTKNGLFNRMLLGNTNRDFMVSSVP